MFNCSFCSYNSNRNFCVKRHEDNIHYMVKHCKPTIIKEIVQEPFVEPEKITEEKQLYYCSKCSKKYLTINSLKSHEKKCIGIDILTCPKCMKSLSCAQSKSRHIKNNNCEPRSVIYAKNPNINTEASIANNIQNIETQNNVNNSNNTNNTINNNNKYKITVIVNNYGNERMDYLNNDEMLKIITNYSNAVPMLIEKKHFNKDFPENHNILYDDKTKKYKVKENNEWRKLSLSLISDKLMKDNVQELLNYCKKNRKLLEEKVQNDELVNYIIQQLLSLKTRNSKIQINKNVYDKIKNLVEEQKIINSICIL